MFDDHIARCTSLFVYLTSISLPNLREFGSYVDVILQTHRLNVDRALDEMRREALT